MGVVKGCFFFFFCAVRGDRLNEKRWMLRRAAGKDNE